MQDTRVKIQFEYGNVHLDGNDEITNEEELIIQMKDLAYAYFD